MAWMAKFSASWFGTGENFDGGKRSSGDSVVQM